MKRNEEKSHVLLSIDKALQVKLGSAPINSGKCEKLLGVKIDIKLTFEEHIRSLCNKAYAKLNALSGVAKYMWCLIMDAFFSAKFSYCFLIWMFRNRSLNHKIKRLHHEQCLGIVYNDNHLSFEELLNTDSYLSINYKNLQFLATEIFRVYTRSAPLILNEGFPLNSELS